MIDIFTDIEPRFNQIVQDLESVVDDAETEIMQFLADDAPVEMQLLMSDNPPSAEGSAPAKRTKTLFNSLKGELKADGTVEIQMVEYALHLDPIFEDEGGGGLNRPFIDIGIQKAYDKI